MTPDSFDYAALSPDELVRACALAGFAFWLDNGVLRWGWPLPSVPPTAPDAVNDAWARHVARLTVYLVGTRSTPAALAAAERMVRERDGLVHADSTLGETLGLLEARGFRFEVDPTPAAEPGRPLVVPPPTDLRAATDVWLSIPPAERVRVLALADLKARARRGYELTLRQLEITTDGNRES